MSELKPCPFGADHKVWIAVHDDEGNHHGPLGCEYESDPWSGLSYGLHHEGWGTCPLCTDDGWETMGGMLFDTSEEAAEAWNTRWERTCHVVGEWAPVSKTQEARKESCSECGKEFGVSRRGGAILDLERLVKLPNYCPDCGFRVMVGDRGE